MGPLRQRLLSFKVRCHSRLSSAISDDCSNYRSLLDGTHDVAEFCVPHRSGKVSLHSDLAAAKETISKVRILEKEFGFHVALSHDAEWMKIGSDKVLMGMLDDHIPLRSDDSVSNSE